MDAGGAERPDFAAIAASSEFIRLRRSHRRFVFPLCLLFFCWYMLYVLLAAYAHDFMSQPVFGLVNVGLLLGMLQFVSTGVITVLYVRYARRKLDPQVDAIREQAEGGVR
jgi:uncharacterized membrane protein (DUF485 family)